MLTKRQFTIRQKYYETLISLGASWDTELIKIKHPYQMKVHLVRTNLMRKLEGCRPWLMTEKAFCRRLEKLSASVISIDLVLRPNFYYGRGLEAQLDCIQGRLPEAWLDHMPLSGAFRFLWSP
jgi:hypothetical protein